LRGQESVVFCSNVAAGNYGPFELKGGVYNLDYCCTGSGTILLDKLGPDGVTYITTSVTVTNGLANTSNVVTLSPGQYRVTIATGTANYASITRSPTD